MKLIVEIEGNLKDGFLAKVIDRCVAGAEDERGCSVILNAVERAIHAENMDIPTGGTE